MRLSLQAMLVSSSCPDSGWVFIFFPPFVCFLSSRVKSANVCFCFTGRAVVLLQPIEGLTPCSFLSACPDALEEGGPLRLLWSEACSLSGPWVSVFDQIVWAVFRISLGSGDWHFGLLVNAILPRLTLDSPSLSRDSEAWGEC